MAGHADGEPGWVGEVIDFWLVETPAGKRFHGGAELDAAIARRFGALYARLRAAPPGPSDLGPRSALAAVIVLDQFPRNMFRGSAEAFATDAAALAIARAAVATRADTPLDIDARLFLYLPFEHSEALADQERAVELISALGDAEWTRFAIAHRDIVRRFGRFPHRNAALARTSTPDEIEFLAGPGSSF